MNKSPEVPPHLEELTDSIDKLAKIIQRMESDRYLQVFTNPIRFFLYSFLHGVFIGLGSTIGVIIVLGVITYILRQLQFFPGIDGIVSFLQHFRENSF